jgi:hypothetical protein
MSFHDRMSGGREPEQPFLGGQSNGFLLSQEPGAAHLAPLRQTEMPFLCPKCGEAGSFTAYRSVNAALHPQVAADLLSGKLLMQRCATCRTPKWSPYSLLYHGPREKLLLVWFPDRERLSASEIGRVLGRAGLPDFPAGYRFRISIDFADFTEKVRIFSAGLDDRAIEWLKYVLAEEGFAKPGTPTALMETMTSREGQPRFAEIGKYQGGEALRFVYPALRHALFPHAGMSDLISFYFPRERYERVAAEAKERLPMPSPLFWRFTRLDHDVVRQAASAGK